LQSIDGKLIAEFACRYFIAGIFDSFSFFFRQISGFQIGQTTGFLRLSQTSDQAGIYFYAADAEIINGSLGVNSPVSICGYF
jgi:hypothetical protein